MLPTKRSKNGCWTCRVRRKKCDESDYPCSNCLQRAVFCHGYGSKPQWKDKGVRERREANKLLKIQGSSIDDIFRDQSPHSDISTTYQPDSSREPTAMYTPFSFKSLDLTAFLSPPPPACPDPATHQMTMPNTIIPELSPHITNDFTLYLGNQSIPS